MKTPYLIQRGTIIKPLAPATNRLSKAVDLDYMGSSEFEFGALAESFRGFEKIADRVVLRQMPEIKENEIALRVYSGLTDEEFEEYKKHLLRMRGGDIHLKEYIAFNPKERSSYMRDDFWWDIENHVMWSFHKPFMNRVGEYVANSIIYMNEERAKDQQC